MRATAIAPANIALIKYWGKRDAALNLPLNDSISLNLSAAATTTTVEFVDQLADEMRINGQDISGAELEKISRHLDLIAAKLGVERARARMSSSNSFPTASGIASSASGFAALTAAAVSALGHELPEKELSILARRGSGSACRSIPDGFVKWNRGHADNDSFAYSLYPANYWAIRDVVAIFGQEKKKVSSSAGHEIAATSPLLPCRVRFVERSIGEIEQSLADRDFTKFGTILESDGLNMHAVMLTSRPAIMYWQPETVALMHQVYDWRRSGLEAYFTIDAGPNVHVICQEKDAADCRAKLAVFPGVREIIENVPAQGVRLTAAEPGF